MSTTNPPIRLTRAEALHEALSSLRIEGLKPNEMNLKLLLDWADHRISAEAVIAAVIGLSSDSGTRLKF